MQARPSRPRTSLGPALAVMPLVLCSLAAARTARAADPLGLYIGAAYGQAHIRAQLNALSQNSAFPLGELDGDHSAYQAMLGIQPLPFLGAEVIYMDLGQRTFGHPPFYHAGLVPGALPGIPVGQQASQKGEGAFALLYLPVPLIDVYLKGGLARITTDADATYAVVGVFCAAGDPNCNAYSVRRTTTDTAFAYGAGVQWKLGHWAVRGEYERFSAAGANPSLLSIGMTYWIL